MVESLLCERLNDLVKLLYEKINYCMNAKYLCGFISAISFSEVGFFCLPFIVGGNKTMADSLK